MFRFFGPTAFLALMLMPALVYAGANQHPEPAIAFTLPDLGGNPVSFDGLKGKVVFITFWASWCASCREELPELDKLYKKFGNEGLEIIGISVDTSGPVAARFLQKVPVSFTILLDTKGDVNDAYRVSGLPAGFIVGKDGVIRYKHRGFGSEFLPIFEKEISELLRKDQ